MPHGYNLDLDDSETLRFVKSHKNGERTEVQADIVSSAQSPGPEQWRALVRDPRGNQQIGTFSSKTEAKRAMKQWISDNPKGVPASGKDISGAGGGIPGMNGNGLF